ncbi:hypothetical protein DPSP01_000002 [Paraphaeosphaeria sporulosa]|uniref:F-box domain-containing protein n=1 Tax=Paraphaeosphaeria sporulosa TaxID=1460663 RepID=A0A177D1G9_9PLEO|nr:uncharacterized protein CC84DRAFT_1255201 [Paraphaeosphaeria sporulosa]OAG13077.1 hypothetical protein CC84DRAFT_1255201 [Paraphaeosphaeria sporulosa]
MDSTSPSDSAATRAPVPPKQPSALLRLPSEIRNRICAHVLDTHSVNDLLFEEAHALASTSRQLRAEFWPYFLARAIFRVDLRNYADLLSIFYPPTSPDVVRAYVGTVGAKWDGARGRSLDLLPLVGVMRASPNLRFTLDAECTWLCSRKALTSFPELRPHQSHLGRCATALFTYAALARGADGGGLVEDELDCGCGTEEGFETGV